ncbi:hypothetical protein GH714_011027 [Hevea brasiliensis]|uniref:ACT domain-containing protein ACR n=1 Tax=Hevea brasiliensis TaxID=3981 RepID=A0A6A6LRN9_HEVBR|nr:hypothetical protein GH714_011027 [Hevea brasiliensis]
MCAIVARLSSYSTIIIPRASPAATIEDENYNESDTIPTPKVIIDQDSDPDATVVEITFGDRLGALIDTMNALKNLGLNVLKANVFLDSSGKHKNLPSPKRYASYRPNLCQFGVQESSSQLAMGVAFGVEPPKQQVDVDIATHINIYDDNPDRSLLYVETADRPGLLVDLVKIITDINITVESGEFDTEVLANSLRYFLRRPTTEEASF